MEKAQHSNKSQTSTSSESANSLSEQEQPLNADLLSSDTAPSYTPRQMMQLQRTIGNQATLRMINRKMLGRIQRDDDDNGSNEGVQSEQEQEPVEEQEDPEVAEQQAEIESIPPEAAQVEAEASAAKVVKVELEDEGDEDTINDAGPSQDDMPVVNDEVPVSNESAPVDNNASSQSSVSPVSLSMNSVSKSKKKKRNKQSGGNAVYKPDRLGGSGVVSGVSQGLSGGAKAVDVGIDATTAAYLIQEGGAFKSALPNSVETASDESASSSLGGLEKVGDFMNTPPVNIILPVASLLQRVYAAYMKYKHYKAFKELAEAGGGINKEALKKKDPSASVKSKVGTYGFLKTKRGLWTRVTKAILTFGQIVARVVTLASGLTASLASEGADLAFALAQGVLKLTESVKGLFKAIKGTRGKQRAKAANQIVDSALSGDADMLKFLVDSEALSKTWFVKMNAANKGGIVKPVASFLTGLGIDPSKISDLDLETLTHQPKNAQQMQDYLNLCLRLNLLKKVSAEVSNVIKST